jgi:hypothetical protein
MLMKRACKEQEPRVRGKDIGRDIGRDTDMETGRGIGTEIRKDRERERNTPPSFPAVHEWGSSSCALQSTLQSPSDGIVIVNHMID